MIKNDVDFNETLLEEKCFENNKILEIGVDKIYNNCIYSCIKK